MEITLEQLKKLRDATGVSMTACKKALEEAGGDFELAIDVLRKKGEAKAGERAGRTTGQGAVVVKSEGGKTAMVELQCETDFVARGDDFIAVGEKMADKLLKGEIKAEDRDFPEITDAALRLGENVQIGNMALIEAPNVGEYIHSNRKIGVVVSLGGGTPELAKDIAMHIAAANPQVLSPDEVGQELVDREKAIWTEQLKSEGKPAEIVEKIMMGKEKKFREENALLKQAFVKDPEKTIEQLVAAAGTDIRGFIRFAL